MRQLLFSIFVMSCSLLTAQAPQKMEVFPNPASDRVRIEFSESRRDVVQITLTDILGNRIIDLEFRPEDPVVIDLAPLALPNGIYLVKAGVNQTTYIKKLVIRHP